MFLLLKKDGIISIKYLKKIENVLQMMSTFLLRYGKKTTFIDITENK